MGRWPVKFDKVDRLWSKYIHLRDGEACRYCGRRDIRLEAAHIVGRRYHATRWLPETGLLLCNTCHEQFDHGTKIETNPFRRDVIEKTIGFPAYWRLKFAARTGMKKRMARMTAEIELTKAIKEMEA